MARMVCKDFKIEGISRRLLIEMGLMNQNVLTFFCPVPVF